MIKMNRKTAVRLISAIVAAIGIYLGIDYVEENGIHIANEIVVFIETVAGGGHADTAFVE